MVNTIIIFLIIWCCWEEIWLFFFTFVLDIFAPAGPAPRPQTVEHLSFALLKKKLYKYGKTVILLGCRWGMEADQVRRPLRESWNSGGRPNKERRWYDTGRVRFESWHQQQLPWSQPDGAGYLTHLSATHEAVVRSKECGVFGKEISETEHPIFLFNPIFSDAKFSLYKKLFK